jgi:Protein of unknown function (DUF3307)
MRRVSWVAVFDVFVVCHLVGDFLFQTDWQATHKDRGLAGDPERRRALVSHVSTYTLAFLPALIWIGLETNLWRALLAAVLIFVPHLIQDDGRLLDAYMRRIKGPASVASPGLRITCDQSFHLVALFGLALLAVA